MNESAVDDTSLRARIYRHFADHGTAPTAAQLSGWAGTEAGAAAALRRLHDSHALVLDIDTQRIRMALPFSAIPTSLIVRSEEQRWFANCAWDALAIPAALGIDASIDAAWLDDDSPVDLGIIDGTPSRTDGFVHFMIPARHWWDDIVET